MAYNKKEDYQAKINEAVAKGDYKAAAGYEQKRNEKIKNEGLSYETTDNYSGYLDTGSTRTPTGPASYGTYTTPSGEVYQKTGASGYAGYDPGDLMIYQKVSSPKPAPAAAPTLGYPLNQTSKRPAYQETAPAPTYEDKLAADIDAALDRILNRSAFSYDPAADPLYQNYANAYQREGQRAMQDTMGMVTANTGGLASSYATSAAQQAQQYYGAKQADVMPELYQLAYQKYLDGIDGQVRDLGLLQNASDMQYGHYRDTMADWRADQNFAYNMYRDQNADWESDRSFNYGASRDQVNDARYADQLTYDRWMDSVGLAQYDDQTAYNRQQDELDRAAQQDGDAFTRAMQLWSMTGVLDEASAAVLGLQAGTKSTDYAYQLAQQAARRSGGGGSSGGTKPPDDGGDNGGDVGIFQRLLSRGIENEGEAYAALISDGHTSTEAKDLIGYYMSWLNEQSGDELSVQNINWNSVISLGYGPLSPNASSVEFLNQKVEAGELYTSVDSNGMVVFTASKKRKGSPLQENI